MRASTILSSDEHARKRQIARRGSLGEGDEVWADAIILRPKPRPEPAEARDDFVGKEEDAVLVDDLLDFRPIAVGRDLDAAGALHRLGRECGDILGPDGQDLILESFGRAQTEVVKGFPVAAVVEPATDP